MSSAKSTPSRVNEPLVNTGFLLAGAVLLVATLNAPVTYIVTVTALYGLFAVTLCLCWRQHQDAEHEFGWANRITLLRGTIAVSLAAFIPFPELIRSTDWLPVWLSVLFLALDGVDGAIARRTQTASSFGARFDMEVDALFILILCALLFSAGKAGLWVFLLGTLRYLFLIAGACWPPLARPLQASRRRQTICVWQIVTLLVALPPVLPANVVTALLLLSLSLLFYSFVVDIGWLIHHRNQWRKVS